MMIWLYIYLYTHTHTHARRVPVLSTWQRAAWWRDSQCGRKQARITCMNERKEGRKGKGWVPNANVTETDSVPFQPCEMVSYLKSSISFCEFISMNECWYLFYLTRSKIQQALIDRFHFFFFCYSIPVGYHIYIYIYVLVNSTWNFWKTFTQFYHMRGVQREGAAHRESLSKEHREQWKDRARKTRDPTEMNGSATACFFRFAKKE